MVGGYAMIRADEQNIYNKATDALAKGKPILFYENDTTCYYIDTITLDGTNIVLTKGGKTITIANDNTITTSGDIQEKPIILDFSSYDISNNIASESDLDDAQEITKDEYDNFIALINKAIADNKPIYYKIGDTGLYDRSDMAGFFVASMYDFDGYVFAIPYHDFSSGSFANMCVAITTYNDKYYVICADTPWML